MHDKKSNKIAAVILAGDIEGKFQAETSFLVHPLAGQPALLYALNAAQKAIGDLPILAINKNFEQFSELTDGSFKDILQVERRSDVQTLRQIEELLGASHDIILLMRADMPLLTSATLEQFLSAHISATDPPAPFAMLTFTSASAEDYRQVLRDDTGAITRVADLNSPSSDSQATHDLDAGVYCLSVEWLRGVIPRLPISTTSEFHLTDLIPIANAENRPIQGIQLTELTEALRIKSHFHLTEAEVVIRQRIIRDHITAGVRIIDPNATYIDAQVEIGPDTVIHPNTYLYGATQIGSGCNIGPNSLVKNTSIGNRCDITFSVAKGAVLEDDVDIGPFAHLRKGAHLAQGVHMGNYGEVKNSYLGPGTKMGHFSYIGDANIGPGVNIGAGVITANYDGENKYATEIGAGAFIGSDSMLVAPLKIGAGARTGAGSVVTKDVPPNSLAVGIPARVIRKREEKDGS
jgi:bifunctional UDP-N-acetylglucosamine pyrophosphorylase/glucosamine-1-phosphate N-acetyltransferase